ncbi:unnamed protein product [Rotaria sordida]|uniref:U-box domain-containing protein n=1 Tax=Rotaria sordida TaxID=392033 RepID=A0A814E6Y6_9BILA|nr:unnamed protein product [Rotaria sordida]CAF1022800.1 unnamed protein product [Rotaria sordida]
MRRKPKTSSMSGKSSTSTVDKQQTNIIDNAETQTAAAAAAATVSSSDTSNSDPIFLEAYDCAKLNRDWHKVINALTTHPNWLIKIPDGRQWTMLHQIVFSGHVKHLDEVLALQISNAQFRLLLKARDGKTIHEVATERSHIHPGMLRRIERLVAVDQLLNNAKDRKWDLVKQSITAKPDIVNEKPPYRRFYLAHHLAFVGQLDVFKDLSKICKFNLDLLAGNQTVAQVAREHNKIPFAQYIESLQTETNDDTNDDTSSFDEPGVTHYSPGFYDDPCISFIPPNLNLNTIFPLSNHSTTYSNNHHHYPHHTTHNPHSVINDHHFATHSLYQGENPTAMAMPTPKVTHSLQNLTNDNHFTTKSIYQGAHSITSSMPMATATQSLQNQTNNQQSTTNNSHQSPYPTTAHMAMPTHTQHSTTYGNNNNDYKKSIKPKSKLSEMTSHEQTKYEETAQKNVKNISEQNLLNSITCCITKTILRDPVVAADGFTYEREAITKWFEHSNRSPMTNQELDNLELKPNYAIKSILQSLQGANSLPTKPDKK